MSPFNNLTVANLSANVKDFASAPGGGLDKNVYHAKVIDFQGGKTVLEVEGRVVVADTEVPLKLNSEFDLVVKGQTSGGRVTLQIIGTREADSTSVRPLTDGMISSRLIGFELPEHEAVLPAARSLLNYGVPVTKANMEAMLRALPQNASRQTIDFAAALLKEGLPVSREVINLIPQMSRELDALPANMKSAAEAIAKTVSPGASGTQTVTTEAGAKTGGTPPAVAVEVQEALNALVAPDGEDKAALIEKLPIFIKAFLHSTEARMQALADLKIAQLPGGQARSEFIDQLISILKVIPNVPPANPEPIDNAIKTLLRQIGNITTRNEALEQIRTEFSQNMAQAMELTDASARLEAARATTAQTLLRILNPAAPVIALPPDEGPSLFNQMIAGMTENTLETINRLEQLMTMMREPGTTPATIKNEILSLLAHATQIQSLQVDADASPRLNEFIDLAGQWAKSTAEIISRQGDGMSQQAARELLAQIIADPENAALLERFTLLTRNPSLRQEIEFLLRHFNDLPDLRTALARIADSPNMPPQLAADLSRSIQFAGLANLAQHTGMVHMESFVTFFPIQMGDKIEIGKLKVFRRSDERSRRGHGPKPLDPFDARLVLVLDTEFLGLFTVTLQTFVNKSIACDIEVKDKRRKKVVEKFLDELRDGLSDTAYEKNLINVRVRRRKPDDSGVPVKYANGTPVTSVDMRI